MVKAIHVGEFINTAIYDVKSNLQANLLFDFLTDLKNLNFICVQEHANYEWDIDTNDENMIVTIVANIVYSEVYHLEDQNYVTFFK